MTTMLFGSSACGGSSDDNIVGNWSSSDGTSKAILENGSCTGMYYNAGRPLDIGGGMTCSFSTETDSDGTHSMVVSQPPNQETLHLKFLTADKVEVSMNGAVLVTLTRQ